MRQLVFGMRTASGGCVVTQLQRLAFGTHLRCLQQIAVSVWAVYALENLTLMARGGAADELACLHQQLRHWAADSLLHAAFRCCCSSPVYSTVISYLSLCRASPSLTSMAMFACL
jgi:hypothetical protein